MAVSLLNPTDLILISRMNNEETHKLIASKSINQALIFRRNLQISLADYSKNHPAVGRFDIVQGKIIGICKQIELGARDAYSLTMWRQLKKSKLYSEMSEKERWKHKIKIRDEWEKIIARFSY